MADETMIEPSDVPREAREMAAAWAKYYANRTPENLQAAIKESSDVYTAGKASGWTWQQIGMAIGVAVISVLVGIGSVAMVTRETPAPAVAPIKNDPDIAKLLTDGFTRLDKTLTGVGVKIDTLGKKIDEKPVPPPVDPDKPKPPPVVTGITLPSTVNISDGHVTIKAVSAGPVTWFIPEYGNLSIDKFADSIVVSARAGANGTYWIGATTIIGDKIATPVYCAITVNQSPQPPPKPDPTPDPKPPTPKVDSLSLVAIYESSDTNSKTAKVVADYVFWESLKSLGVKWFKIDKDQKDANGSLLVDSHNYRQYVDKHGLPCLLFMDSAGLVVRAIPLPDSTATVRANITQLMGK